MAREARGATVYMDCGAGLVRFHAGEPRPPSPWPLSPFGILAGALPL
jgi:hypothetical protein